MGDVKSHNIRWGIFLLIPALLVSLLYSPSTSFADTVTASICKEAREYFKRAQKAFEAGNYQTSAEYFRKVLELEPDLTVAQEWLDTCLIQIAYDEGVELANWFEYELAVEKFKEALHIDNTLMEIHDWLAFCYVNLGMDQEAIEEYRMVTELKPTVDNLVNLGITQYRLGYLEESEVSLRKALELDAEDENAVNNLTLVLLELGKIKEVDRISREAISRNPGNYTAYNNLGIALIEQYRFEEAVDALSMVIKKRQDFAEAHFSLACAYLGLDELQKAGDHYSAYLQYGGGDPNKEQEAINFLFQVDRYYEVPIEMRFKEE